MILFNDKLTDQDEESVWMNSISNNSAFDFLNDPREEIYSKSDGEPFDD